jgi:3',5'-cyclic AMP phosphodiesterase CpdA
MFRLAHISDVHLGPLPHFRKRDLVSKRITGYLNWRRNRAKSLGSAVLAALIDNLHAAKPDYIAMTGDLVNLSLDAELPAAKLWMEALGEPNSVSYVPGNHDAYVIGALQKTTQNLAEYISDQPQDLTFPSLRIRGDIALIGVNSARATPVFVAAGYVSDRQMQALKTVLVDTGKQGLCRVIMIHHPPVRGAASRSKRLYGIRKFQRVIREAGAELVLHGHTHLPTLNWISGPDKSRIPVVGVSAAAQSLGGKMPASGWNEFEIEKRNAGFSIQLIRHQLTSDKNTIIELERVFLS